MYRRATGVECVVDCGVCWWCQRVRPVNPAESTARDSQPSNAVLADTASRWSAVLVTLLVLVILTRAL